MRRSIEALLSTGSSWEWQHCTAGKRHIGLEEYVMCCRLRVHANTCTGRSSMIAATQIPRAVQKPSYPFLPFFCRNLEVCEVYYNVGRSGIRSDIPLWIHKFISGCPRIKTFTLWTPSGDCGGFDNACLAAVCRGWEGLEILEVSGEGMNLDGKCNGIALHMHCLASVIRT